MKASSLTVQDASVLLSERDQHRYRAADRHGQLGKDTPINWTTKVERKKEARPGRRPPKCTQSTALRANASGCRSGRSG